MKEETTPHNEPIPESLIQDKQKAEEMAYSEDPYQVLIANAEQAATNGVTGMDTVLEELKNNMNNTAHQTGEAYDERRQFIEECKSIITKEIINALKGGVKPGQSKSLISSEKGTIPIESIQKAKLHPEELNEIRDTAYALLGIERPQTMHQFTFTSRDSIIPGKPREQRLDATTLSPTGLSLKETILYPQDNIAFEEDTIDKPLLRGQHYFLRLEGKSRESAS